MPGSTPQRQSQRIPQQSGEFSTARSGEITSATDSGQVRDRRDPVAERKAAAAAQRALEGEAKRVAVEDAFTVGKLVDAWEARALSLRREGYRKEATARVRQSLAGLLARPAAKVTRADAATALEMVAAERGAISGNRVMAYARACYGWALKANLLEVNPFAGLAAPGREKARARVLTINELQGIWAASATLGPVQQGFVRFLLLTLQRREEVAGATWGEISPDLSTWTVPAARAKNGRAHIVHLAQATRTVLEGLPRGKGDGLIFAVPGGKKLSSFSVIKRDLDAAIAQAETTAAAEQGRDAVPMPGWVFHDFRRAGVTALADRGFPPHVCDRLLNHVTGAIQGVAAVYQRAEFLTERRAALEAWASLVVGDRS